MEHIWPLCENKDQISELQGLRNRFLEKLEKKRREMKNYLNLYLQKIHQKVN